jgi:hypothetical protein
LLAIYLLAVGTAFVGWTLPFIFDLGIAEYKADLAGWFVYGIGIVAFMLFARMVFRPGTIWASWIVGSCALAYFSGLTVWVVQAPDYYAVSNPWFWCVWLGYTAPCVWMSIEAFLAYRSAKRRAQIGLCDPTVANRYLLFGWFGAFQAFASGSDIPEAMQYSIDGTVSSEIDLLLGTLVMIRTAILFLAFFPPAAYLSWITGAQKNVDSPAEG